MDQNEEFLTFINKNAEMGVTTLTQLNDAVGQSGVRKIFERQLLEYKSVFDQSQRMLQSLGTDFKGLGTMAKISSYVMINVKTLMDKSEQNVASMIMQGSTRGIIEITKNLKKFVDCRDDIKNLAYKLLWTEQKNFDEMKHFL